ncbi:MAG: hypothetical protein CMA72_09445 [Euryarchaeota archaeon]|nr:hypothetical protein [Euryarchaeota archaeon]|tara:strand:+ start:7471 stop:7890 length:420 start_codon:yes stop_codon:yes gene_type:complete
MSINSKSFSLARTQQPRSRIRKNIPIESKSSSRSPTSTNGRTVARRNPQAKTLPEQPAQRSSVSQGNSRSDDNQSTQRKSAKKQRPKDLRRVRAFQAGASRPKFQKSRINVANPSQQITKKRRKAKTSVIKPGFKKVKI